MSRKSVHTLDAISDEDLKLITIIHSGFAGANVAAVVQMSGLERTSPALLVSLACFAVSIPFSLLVVLLLNYRALERNRLGKPERFQVRYWPGPWLIQTFRHLAYITSFGGFLALFWSFHTLIGMIFLFASAIAFVIALAAEYFKSRPFGAKPAPDEDSRPIHSRNLPGG